MQFASGHAWGSVRRADVRLGDQQASALPIQLVEDRDVLFSRVPPACSSTGPSVVPLLDATAILDVGMERQDCGLACAISADAGIDDACDAQAGCAPSRLDGVDQIAHPVAMLPRHDNGVVLLLPQVPLGGPTGTDSALVLGITGACRPSSAGPCMWRWMARPRLSGRGPGWPSDMATCM